MKKQCNVFPSIFLNIPQWLPLIFELSQYKFHNILHFLLTIQVFLLCHCRLSRRIFWIGVANFVLSPFILLWVILYSFFTYAEVGVVSVAFYPFGSPFFQQLMCLTCSQSLR